MRLKLVDIFTSEISGEVSIQGELSVQVPVSRAFNGKGKISARPEQLFFSKEGMPGKILFSTFLGDFIEYEVELDDGQNFIVNEYTKDTQKSITTESGYSSASTLPDQSVSGRHRGGAVPVKERLGKVKSVFSNKVEDLTL